MLDTAFGIAVELAKFWFVIAVFGFTAAASAGAGLFFLNMAHAADRRLGRGGQIGGVVGLVFWILSLLRQPHQDWSSQLLVLVTFVTVCTAAGMSIGAFIRSLRS